MPNLISLDEIMSRRQMSVKSTPKGDALTKLYRAPASWDGEARAATFIMTAQVKDRYGDIVVTKGAKTDDFLKNPVVLWAHNSRAFPIGMWSDLKTISGSPRRLEGRANLAPLETTPEADTVAKLLAANMVRACSIGFMPIEWEAIDKEHPWAGYQFNEWELLECSICSVPANPAALVKAAGGDTGLALQAIELVLEEWARTPDGLIVPRERYELAYKVTKNQDVTLHEVRSVEEEEETPSVEEDVNPLDVQAAVSRGLAEVFGEKFWSTMRSIIGKEEPKQLPAPEPEKKAVEEDDGGETEEQFQARIAAKKAAEPDLSDEADEKALRERAAALV